MTVNHAIFSLLSLIVAFSTYQTVAILIGNANATFKREKLELFLVNSSTAIGMLGTFLGFFVGFEDGVTQETAATAIAIAVPTTIAGLSTYFVCSLLMHMRTAFIEGDEQ